MKKILSLQKGGSVLKKFTKIFILFLFFLSLVLFSQAGVEASDLNFNLDMKMRPDWVRLNPRLTGIEYNNWLMECGLYVHGHLHESDKLWMQVDPLTISRNWENNIFKAGYFRPNWNKGNFESIMLSGNAPALPGINFKTSFLDFTYERFGVRFKDNRGDLFGHRLQKELIQGVEVGVKETVIISETYDGYWLNFLPFWPYYFNKYIPAPPTDVDNMNVGVDIFIDYFEDIELYGDFHVTEWPFLPESEQPPVYGLKLSFLRENFKKENLTLKLTYNRLMNYLYSARDSAQFYQYQGYSLGEEIGPDAQELEIKLEYPFRPDLSFSSLLKLKYKGEGEIGDYWDSLKEGQENIFLSGTVEKSITPGIGIDYMLTPEMKFTANLEVEFVENYKHRPHNSGTRTRAMMGINIDL